MAGQHLSDDWERDATPRPGRYRPWFLGVLIVWWLVGCVALARGGMLAGALVLGAEGALVLALDGANVLALHGLLSWRARGGWGRVVAVGCVLVLAPLTLALYLAVAARHVWSRTEHAERNKVVPSFAPGTPPAWRREPLVGPLVGPMSEEAPTTPMPWMPPAAAPPRSGDFAPTWEDAPSRRAPFVAWSPAYMAANREEAATPSRRRRAFLLGGGALAVLLLVAAAFAFNGQGGPFTSLLGPGASNGTTQGTGGRHSTASTSHPAQGPSATATATTLPPTATSVPMGPTSGVQPATPGNTGNGDGGQGTPGAQPPAQPTTPAMPTLPPGTTTTSGLAFTAAQLAAAERALPTVYVPSLEMTFSCAGSNTAFCVRDHPGTRVNITLYAECAGTGGQVMSLTRTRAVGDTGVLRWNWQPARLCAQGVALAVLTTPDGEQHLALAVTRDPPVQS